MSPTRGRVALIDPRKLEVAETLAGVADVHEADGPDRWLIDFGPWTVAWPNDFSLESPEGLDTPFVLTAGGGGVIWVQEPFSRMPAEAEDCVAPGQRPAGRADGWVVLHHEHDGEGWLQRHHFVPGSLMVTAQVPRDAAGEVVAAAIAMAEQLAAS